MQSRRERLTARKQETEIDNSISRTAPLDQWLCAHHAHLCVSLSPPQVQWQGKGPEAATWLTRDDLVEMGLEKMVTDLDMKEAARAVSGWIAKTCIFSTQFHLNVKAKVRSRPIGNESTIHFCLHIVNNFSSEGTPRGGNRDTSDCHWVVCLV